MNGFAELVQPRSPCVVPHTAPIGLFLEANDVGNRRPLTARGFECSQLSEPAGSGTDNSNTLSHFVYPGCCGRATVCTDGTPRSGARRVDDKHVVFACTEVR